jgi:hypothetical protein
MSTAATAAPTTTASVTAAPEGIDADSEKKPSPKTRPSESKVRWVFQYSGRRLPDSLRVTVSLLPGEPLDTSSMSSDCPSSKAKASRVSRGWPSACTKKPIRAATATLAA